MLELGSLAFATPWMLAALATLPVLYWLLRVTPPAPRRVVFPAVRILASLEPSAETPARTPWWLLAMRILAAALVIVGLAQPVMNPDAALHGSGPVLIVVDNSWAAAGHWPLRQRMMQRLIDRADRQGRAVALLATAPEAAVAPDGGSIAATAALPPEQARRRAQAIRPRPWPAARAEALAAVTALSLPGSVSVFWLSDGLEDPLSRDFAERLQGLGSLDVMLEPPSALAKLVARGRSEGVELAATLIRPAASGVETVTVRVIADDGRLLTREPVDFEAASTEADMRVTLPLELRNQVARLEIDHEETAGAVLLADAQWRRRPIGIITTAALDNTQPLLTETHYLERALAPFSDIARGEFAGLEAAALAVILLPDSAGLTETESDALAAWVENGGTLVRFGGPRLAQSAGGLLPVRLRSGSRQLGGALSWARPARLAPFDAESPFAGLSIPRDVTVRRQVLAEPELDLAAKTWARLVDGTPLVTTDARGDGRVVLIHTTADTGWSDLALSGLFVEMLRRIVQHSRGVSGAAVSVALPPYRTLDAAGRLRDPAPDAVAIEPGTLAATVVSPRHPPGLYGSAGTRTAVNLSEHLGDSYGTPPQGRPVPRLRALDGLPSGVTMAAYGGGGGVDLKPWLILAAVLLVLADMVISLVLRGLMPRVDRPAPASLSAVALPGAGLLAAGLLAATVMAPDPATAQVLDRIDGEDSRILDATVETRLAYIVTGIEALDAVSRAGLTGLTEILRRRTAVEAAAPMAVDPAVDEMVFFPLIYWPIDERQRDLSPAAIDRINTYLRTGGTILFDTRDAAMLAPGYVTGSGLASGPGGQRLRQLARSITIPPLQTVPPDHVLTKAFYLMQDFPGRHADAAVWVELPDGRVNDGVASVIVGGNDWASAWAIDETGRPVYPVGGGDRQREMAYRFGVNLMMYALTGNYKADQVHVPQILERLGQ